MTTHDLAPDTSTDEEPPRRRWVRRHWRPLAAAGIVVAFAAGVAVVNLSGDDRDPQREQIYLELVREDVFPGGDDESLLEIGYGICGLYDDGYTWVEVIAGLTDNLSGTEAGTLNAYATGALCPEHADKAPSR